MSRAIVADRIGYRLLAQQPPGRLTRHRARRSIRAVIVDSHYHLLHRDWFPEPLWETLASHLGVHVSGDRGRKLTAAEFAQKYFPILWDPEGEKLLRHMDELEIDVTVMLVDDFNMALGEPPVSIEGQNKAFADLDDVCSDFPDLKIVAAHSGRTLWWETVASMAAIHPNLHGDLAGWQTLAVRDYPRFCRLLRS